MSVQQDVLQVLDDVLVLNGRSATMGADTELLGALPELDSVSVMGVIAGLEESFGIRVTPDELDAAAFETVGSLSGFVEQKLQGTKPKSGFAGAMLMATGAFSTGAPFMTD